MKAKDYYAKYGERLMNPKTSDEALDDIFADFNEEVTALMEQRKANSDKSVLAILDEMNKKWNALAEMFPVPTLIRNGYLAVWYGKLGITKEDEDKIRKRRGI